jgi:peptide/nickel transport system substrate-binding protein
MPNLEQPGPAEKAVRQALYAAINKQAIIDIDLLRPAQADRVLRAAANPGRSARIFLPKRDLDLALANKLLDDAGWKRSGSGTRMKNGVPLEFAVSRPRPVTRPCANSASS